MAWFLAISHKYTTFSANRQTIRGQKCSHAEIFSHAEGIVLTQRFFLAQRFFSHRGNRGTEDFLSPPVRTVRKEIRIIRIITQKWNEFYKREWMNDKTNADARMRAD
jgi:hypothetical protein